MSSNFKNQATVDAPASQSNPPGVVSLNGWRRVVPLLVVCLVFLTFVTLPQAPPGDDGGAYEADSSFSLILDYAHQHGLQFGTQHAYTYGPLGFLIFFYYGPQYPGLHMMVDVLLGLAVSLGLFLVASRLRIWWQCLLFGSFIWVAANIHPRTELVIDTGLLCFGLLCFVENGRRLLFSATILTALAVFSALAKNSFLFVATLTVAIVAADLLVRGRLRLGLGMLAGFGGGFLSGWVLSGQSLLHLGPFVANALAMVRGYNAALGWEESLAAGWIGLGLALLVTVLIVIATLTAFEAQARFHKWRRLFLLGWILALGFASWKHGFVRANICNTKMFFGFLAVLAVALQSLPSEFRKAKLGTRVLGLAACLLSVLALQWLFFEPLSASLTAPFRAVRYNLNSLLDPAGYFDRMDAAIAENRRGARLPKIRQIVGQASVDVFGRRQAYAIYNDLQYRPRPVPQSYAVCNTELMRLNQQFYLSKDAPDFVLFELGALDRKFPPLEDAWVLRNLLINYQPVASEEGFILLNRRSIYPPELVLLREATVAPGQQIDLREFGTASLWVEIELEPSISGRLRQFLLRPPTVRLSAYGSDGALLMRGRAPASMLAAGFLASPLLVRTEDVTSLYSGGPVTRPEAYSVDLLPGEEQYWRARMRMKIYRVENPILHAAAEGLSPFSSVSRAGAVSTSVDTNAAAGSVVAGGNKPARPFSWSRVTRWRPDQPLPGNFQETFAFLLMMLLPFAAIGLLAGFARWINRQKRPVGWRELLIGNGLVLLFLLSLALLAGEIYFRFFYDTTDSLGYTRVCERWVQRHWHVNQAGCRDDIEYKARVAPGKRRISFIGDSFTAGHGIKNVEDRFPNLLRQGHPNWEVHVLASVGLDTGREAILLKRALNQGYQLDQVVLVYCLNDIGDLLPQEGIALAQVAGELANTSWPVRNSYAINFLYHRYKAARSPALKNYFPFVRSGYSGAAWEQQKARLRAFRDEIQSQGGRLSVITFPFLHALGPNYEYQFVHDELDQFWEELQVPHLDLLKVYKTIPPEKLTVNSYDAHPNEYASRLAAPVIDHFLSSIVQDRDPRPGSPALAQSRHAHQQGAARHSNSSLNSEN